MSMPSFPKPDPDLNKEQALSWILASIAMEEAALSNLINAESEKLKWAHKCLQSQDPCCDIDKVLAVHQSANDLMESALDMQVLLKRKMQRALQHISEPSPPKPHSPKPCPPKPRPSKSCPPKPPVCQECCPSVLFQASACTWDCKAALPLKQAPSQCNWATLWPLGSTKILLPISSRLKVDIDLEFMIGNCFDQDVIIELRQTIHEKILMKKTFRLEKCQKICQLLDNVTVLTDSRFPQTRLSLVLISPHQLNIQHGFIEIYSA